MRAQHLYTRDETGEFIAATSDEIITAAKIHLSQRFRRGATLNSPRATRDFLNLKLGVLDHEVFARTKQRMKEVEHGERRLVGMIRVLNHEELQAGDVSLEYVSKLMNRRYTDSPTLRRVLQTIWYQVNHGQEIYVVGVILPDGTVRGGTGWGAEFAKLCNKPLSVFDEEKNSWFSWTGSEWRAQGVPKITHPHFTGTGTRKIHAAGTQAIDALFENSFGGR